MALARAAQIGKGALRDTELLEAASRFGELDHMSTLRNKSQIDFSIAVCDLCVCVSPTVDIFAPLHAYTGEKNIVVVISQYIYCRYK